MEPSAVDKIQKNSQRGKRMDHLGTLRALICYIKERAKGVRRHCIQCVYKEQVHKCIPLRTIMSESENSEDRKKLYESAVSFLNDPSVSDAPLAMKIKFLEKKGLNQDEIEQAIKEAGSLKNNQPQMKENNTNTAQGLVANKHSNPDPSERRPYNYSYQALPPVVPQRDWKDYFIMATATAGIVYGLFEVTKRYIAPNILPESSTKLEQDKEEIQAHFSKVDKLLESIEQEQHEFKEKETKKLGELDDTIKELQNTLEKTTQTRDTMENDFKLLKLELNNLQNAVDKFVSGNNITTELNSMNNEITSLKNLISNSSFGESASNENKQINKASGLTTSIKSDIGASTNANHSIKSPVNGIPGVEAIPSAAELLANMNFDTSEDENTEVREPIPAWKKVRDENVSQLARGNNIKESSQNDLPAWQVAMEAAQNVDEQ